jgi:hypothetical protein
MGNAVSRQVLGLLADGIPCRQALERRKNPIFLTGGDHRLAHTVEARRQSAYEVKS